MRPTLPTWGESGWQTTTALPTSPEEEEEKEPVCIASLSEGGREPPAAAPLLPVMSGRRPIGVRPLRAWVDLKLPNFCTIR